MPMMVYSKNGLNLTEQFESCRLTAYQDASGVWTIGWGHVGQSVVEGLVWTQAQANSALSRDIQASADAVNSLVIVVLTQNEFDALVDFTYNVGIHNFATSGLLSLLNTGRFDEAAAHFDLWDHSGGKVVAGLLRRRQDETNLF